MYKFSSFQRAITFIIRVARVAELLNHHPDICIISTTVTLTSTTHSAGGIVTKKDRELMKEVTKVYKKNY